MVTVELAVLLGFKLAQPTANEQFVRLADVQADSAAGKAGLKTGDEILAVGTQALSGPVGVQHAVLSQQWLPNLIAGVQIWLKVRRLEAGQVVEKEVKYVTD